MPTILLKTKAVIFDMDGVITNTMPDHFRAWKEIFAAEGVEVSHHDIYSREGQRGLHSVFEIFDHHQRSISMEKARNLLFKKEQLFKKMARQRFIPGARKFLADLWRAGFDLGLVTGTSRHEVQRILPEKLFNLFKVTITGSDVKKGKPHPEPFKKALQALKIKPQDGVVLENAPFGILSAKGAGVRCLALETSLPRQYLTKADYVFHSINDLRSQVRFVTN